MKAVFLSYLVTKFKIIFLQMTWNFIYLFIIKRYVDQGLSSKTFCDLVTKKSEIVNFEQ
jgi:hypothetical protein